MELAELQLAFLGGLSVQRGGEPVPGLTSQKALALLAYLAVTGRPHSRLALAGLLWGGMPESSALMNLRKALHQLRQPLGDHISATRSDISFIRSEHNQVDTNLFTKAEPLARAKEGLLGAQLARLEEAIAFYQGDFLEGFYVHDAPEFEQWVLSHRAYYRELALQILRSIASDHARQGQYKSAIEFTRQLIRLEPWSEEAHRELIRLLAYDGQRSVALAQYATCQQILQEELGVKPSEETQLLYQSIQTGNLRHATTSPSRQIQIQSQPPAFLDEERPSGDTSQEPFVRRENQLSKLQGYLEASLAGKGSVAFISAEAGWGKSSLLTHFSRRSQELHPALIVASGMCTTYTGAGDPYLPFREILRMLSGDVEGKWSSGTITRHHALRLWNLLPTVVETLVSHGRNLIDTFLPGEALLKQAIAHGSVQPEALERLQSQLSHRQDTTVNQERIFEEYTDVLAEIARTSPLLLILDDLHWADASSINLFFHLGKRLIDHPIMLLGAYRTEDIHLKREGKDHPLVNVLDEFKRRYGDIWLNLDQIDHEESRRFVNALLDTQPNRFNDNFRDQLTHNTNGHPLFTVEIFRELQERGDISRDDSGFWIDSPTITWNTLPGRVEGVIEKRINRLDAQLSEILIAASVEGEEFSAEVVARVCKVNDENAVRMLSLDLARRHNLIQARGVIQSGDKRISRYQFSHNLFQKYLYSTLDPIERAYLHEAVGSALEKLYQGQTEEVAVHLARHFREAGAVKKTIHYLKQAGEAAARIYANAEAIIHYRQAINLAEQVKLSDEELASLYARLGRLLELNSSFTQALEIYEMLAKLANQRGNPAMELTSLMARVTILSVPTAVHDPKQALELGERALLLAGELNNPAAEAKILWSLSIAHFFSNRLQDAVSCGERSLALARQHNLIEQTAQTLNDLGGFIYLYSGRIDPAREALQEANSLWHKLGNTPMLADSLSGSCIAHVYAGDFDRAIACSSEAFQISQSIENLWGQSYSRWTIGDAYAERGEYSRAIEAMEECIHLGKEAGFLASQTYTPVKLAKIYMDLGDSQKALELVQQALDLSRAYLPTHIVQGLGVLARLQILMGNLNDADATIKAGHNDPYRESWTVFYLPILFAEVELALHTGCPSAALSVSDELITRLRSYGMHSLLPEALYLQGRVLLNSQQESSAFDRFLEARTVAKAVGSQRRLWRISWALSQLEKDPHKAIELHQEANQVIEFILDHFDTKHANLRETFINQDEVQAIIQGNR